MLDRDVFVANEQTDISIEPMRWALLGQMILDEEQVPHDAELSLIFVDEKSITDLNERFLGGSGPTDVLSFPVDDDIVPVGRQPDEGGRGPGADIENDEPPALLGDVVIAPLVAQRQAPEHENSTDEEIAALVIHGVLHLLNYDHGEEGEALAMRSRESELMDRFRKDEIRASTGAVGGIDR